MTIDRLIEKNVIATVLKIVTGANTSGLILNISIFSILHILHTLYRHIYCTFMSLPLIFSGPYEKTNSTFPYSGNLSSVDTHGVKTW